MNQKKRLKKKTRPAVPKDDMKIALQGDITLLSNLLNSTSEYITIIDKKGKIIFANSNVSRFLNITLGKLLGQHYYSFMPEELAETRKRQDKEVIRSKKTLFFNNTFGDKYLLVRESPVFDGKGNISSLAIMAIDISGQKAAEDALRENEYKFRAIFENSVEGIILVDDTGSIMDWNKFIAERTGISKEEAIGKKLWNIQYRVITDDIKKIYSKSSLKEIWLRMIRTLGNNEIVSKEGKLKGVDGNTVLTEEIIFTMMMRNKRSLCIIQRDLTERRKAEEALKESEQKLKLLNKTQNKLFSIIAHDLKSPFSTLHGYLQLLRDSIRDSDIENSEKYLDTIISSSRNNLNLLTNLLTWARSQTGQIEFSPRNYLLKPVVEGVVDILRSSAEMKNISIDINIPSKVRIFADDNMIKTVLHNLISNAIKFTQRGGSILIRSKPEKDHINIYVSDTGVGIITEEMKKLFDISYITTSRGTEEEGGTGLGLFICREFIEKHGGKISVESKLGTGSTFIISLPDMEK